MSVEAQVASPALPGEPLGFGRDHRRGKAQSGPRGTELAADVLVVDAPERGLGIVAQPVLHLPRSPCRTWPPAGDTGDPRGPERQWGRRVLGG